jgi:mono/diheme cytochrome c family protein
MRTILPLLLLMGCQASSSDTLPTELAETGIDDPATRAYAPAWDAWSDGADKSRWIRLPDGASIDASQPDAWVFPVGTKLWKEFRLAGKKIETRMQWKDSPTHWTLAAYVWSDDQSRATLATQPSTVPGTNYEIPAGQCGVCHQAAGDKPLGFSAAMLAAPAATGMTMATLIAEGRITNLPSGAEAAPLAAASPVERDALGYLHANCGLACHRPGGSAPFSLRLPAAAPQTAQDTDAWQAINRASGFTPAGASDRWYRIRPTDEEHSSIFYRMSSRTPGVQMPPVATHVVDEQGRAALAAWINAMVPPNYPAPAPLQ